MLNQSYKKKLNRKLYLIARFTYLSARSFLALLYGFIYFGIKGKTPEIAYQALIWEFCATGGRFNNWVSQFISWKRPPVQFTNRVGVLGDMSDEGQLKKLVGQIQEKGFVVFPNALSESDISQLIRFTHLTPALVRRRHDQVSSLHIGKEIYSGEDPSAVRYDYEPSDLLDNECVQNLLADGSILSIAQEYLRCEPIADVLSMWWHTNFQKTPDAEAAQYFHFDMDRIKWLKIFVYLTEVGLDNGPHAFIEGSHSVDGIPSEILNRGYVRIMDDEIASNYSADRVHSFVGSKGTIIIEDTRGLHKGTHVMGDPRLILQLQFSNSLFGASYPRSYIKNIKSEALKKVLSEHEHVYSQYLN